MMPDSRTSEQSSVYLIGGGIASLAAAAFLIRDAAVPGNRITIFEASSTVGGSLDASKASNDAYVMRGGRMLESKYRCTFDLFSSIPTLDKSKSVTEEIFEWNNLMKTVSRSRLFRNGHRENAPDFGLTEKDIAKLQWLGVTPEWALGRSSIRNHFGKEFFASGFWLMWCTTFAFQPWHSAVEFKRYLLRFMHMVSGFNTLTGIMRTVYNQYDSMVRPLEQYLREHGVRFAQNTCVTNLKFVHSAEGSAVEAIQYRRDGWSDTIRVNKSDYVFLTLGSMTECSTFGSMTHAPTLDFTTEGGLWALWKKVAAGRPQFGRPEVFADHIADSKWVSFTTTLHDEAFFRRVRDLTGNVPGEGGLITFPDSNWLASIVLPHQPHFLGQPADVQVFWGYGLSVDRPGNFVAKPMSACNGREIMTEILGHLGMTEEAEPILANCTCIPCMMPYITSQFLCREKGDRPEVVPERSLNLALLGQFCELPDDVVFTVEYSVRSAQTAVYQLLKLDRKPPAVYQGKYDLRVLLKASLALHGV